MVKCPSCGVDNPDGSKFCAGCGAAVPTVLSCASCGAVSPPGAKFCKNCGAAVQGVAAAAGPAYAQAPPAVPVQPPIAGGRVFGGVPGAAVPGAVQRPGALSENLTRLKTLLFAAMGFYGVGLFLGITGLGKLNQFAQAGYQVDTSQAWFFILIDSALSGLSAFAIMQLGKGVIKTAKASTVANAILGGIALLLSFKGGILYIVLNGGLAATGVWGRMLISKEERPLV